MPKTRLYRFFGLVATQTVRSAVGVLILRAHPRGSAPEKVGPFPQPALAEARALIERHGYGRRRDELADAVAAAAHW